MYHSPSDTDVMIVQKMVESATVTDTVLVGDDTDLLVLVCYYAYLGSHTIFFKPKITKKPRVWNISAVKQKLCPEICSNLLFLHAILFTTVKSALFKKFRSSEHFQEQAKMFCTTSATPKDILLQESKL